MAQEIYSEVFAWLCRVKCQHIVSEHLIEHFAVSQARYIQCALVFINHKDQLPLYVLIYTGVPLIIAISYFPIVFKYVNFAKPVLKDAPVVLKESFVYFVPTIAIAIYSMIDKTMLGLFDPTQVSTGLYESTDKLIKVAIAVCTASYTIVRTRMLEAEICCKDLIITKRR